MAPFYVQCGLGCGRLVDAHGVGVFRKVEGWEQHRDQGGTNAVALRHPLDFWAHPSCVDRAKKMSVQQESLL